MKWLWLLWLMVAVACGGEGMNAAGDSGTPAAAADVITPQASPEAGNNSGMGMGGMRGMGGMGAMQTAHHATIPDAYDGLTNPSVGDPDAIERGAAIYTTTCAVCHGDGGMGDGSAAAGLDPAPAPIAQTARMMSDAYLYWRVSEGGKGDPITSSMPAWKDAFDEQARWDVISYIQALGAGTMEPRMGMGGMRFDPAVERQNRQAMLDTALEQGLFDTAEAETFMEVHDALDLLMEETGLRMQEDNMVSLLAILVDRGTVTSAAADTFVTVHDTLLEAGLMQ